MSGETDRIKGLDGLRAIAVLMVFLNHKAPDWRIQELNLGGFGVHLFYVLSGFLIIGILHRRQVEIGEGRANAKEEWLRFLANRSFRIFPVYYALLLVLALASAAGWLRVPAEHLAAMFTYTTNFFVGHVWHKYPEVGGHLWSLAVEEQFYLIAAPVLLFIPARYAKAACWIAIAIGVLSSTYAVVTEQWRQIYVGSLSGFALLSLGGLTALYLPRLRFPTWAGVACLIAYCLSPLPTYYLSKISKLAETGLYNLSTVLMVVVVAAIVHNQRSLLVRVLHSTPLRVLGRVSYGFYLFHPFIDVKAFFPTLSAWVYLPLDFALTVALSGLSWMAFEKPILDLRHKLLPKPKAAKGPPPASEEAAVASL